MVYRLSTARQRYSPEAPIFDCRLWFTHITPGLLQLMCDLNPGTDYGARGYQQLCTITYTAARSPLLTTTAVGHRRSGTLRSRLEPFAADALR